MNRSMLSGVLLPTLAALMLAPPAVANTLVVDDGSDCPDADSPTIQGAVVLAEPGDTIHVCEGTYPEQVNVDKSDLEIEARGPEGAVVVQAVPPNTLHGFRIGTTSGTAPPTTGVLLEGFTVTGYQNDIRLVNASGNTIRRNVTTAATDHAGIFLDANSSENVVEHNDASRNAGPRGVGIRIAGATSARNVVRHNTTNDNTCVGIQIGGGPAFFATGGPAGPGNEILHNVASANGDNVCTAGPPRGNARGVGINNTGTPETLIAHNRADDNDRIGITVVELPGPPVTAVRVVVAHNHTERNGSGQFPTAGEGIRIQVEGLDRFPIAGGIPTENVVRYNDSRRNARVGISVLIARGVLVEHNALDENGTSAPGVGIELHAALETDVRHNVSRGHSLAGYWIHARVRATEPRPVPAILNTVANNLAKGNPGDGILLENADDNQLVRNRSDHNGQDGLHADAESAANTIIGNGMMENGEPPAFYDCRDDTPGLLNTWLDNHGRTENKPGLCEHGAG